MLVQGDDVLINKRELQRILRRLVSDGCFCGSLGPNELCKNHRFYGALKRQLAEASLISERNVPVKDEPV